MNVKRLIAKGLRALLQPPAITNSSVNKKSKIYSGSQINNSKIEKYTYVGHDCFLLSANIGPFCSIADNCRIGGASHTIQYVSSSPCFNKGTNSVGTTFAEFDSAKDLKIDIGADVWIGAGATIKSGVTIGVGAVIGAASVVTHDVPPYEVWAGNPARKIKDRFDEETKKKLLRSEWWLFEDNKLKENAQYFNDPKKFLSKIVGDS